MPDSIYPVATSPSNLQILDIPIFTGIHFFSSFHQIIVLVIVGTMKPIQTRNAICIPEKDGNILMRNERVITIKNVATNSESIIFHIHCIAFFISASLNESFP